MGDALKLAEPRIDLEASRYFNELSLPSDHGITNIAHHTAVDNDSVGGRYHGDRFIIRRRPEDKARIQPGTFPP